MAEDVLFVNEQYMERTAVASYLRTVADRLDAGDPITLGSGNDTATVTPPGTVEFEVKVEREGPPDGPGEIGLELELEWDENDDTGGEFTIE